jgi:hypothetical protein
LTGQVCHARSLHAVNRPSCVKCHIQRGTAEICSDAATSDPTGNLLSFFRAVNGGDATGGADVDDDVALFDISGVTIATGNMVAASATEANYSHSVRVRINGTNYYMMLASAEG